MENNDGALAPGVPGGQVFVVIGTHPNHATEIIV